MHSFFEAIKTTRGTFEFSFLRIFTVDGIRFFITVIDERAKSHLFYMEKKEGEWMILDKEKVADWILEKEEDFKKAITANCG